MSDWCILRTSGRHTLVLAQTLRDDGFEVWTPETVLSCRLPRRKSRVDRTAAMLPTFVFAGSRHIPDLLTLSDAPKKRAPNFSVFRYLGRVPVVADRDLEAIRDVEKLERMRAKRKAPRRTFDPGTTVRVEEGAFSGMSGIVEDGGGKHVLVCFHGISVKIASFLLVKDEANTAHPAAEAA